jgi:hypothetical protein
VASQAFFHNSMQVTALKQGTGLLGASAQPALLRANEESWNPCTSTASMHVATQTRLQALAEDLDLAVHAVDAHARHFAALHARTAELSERCTKAVVMPQWPVSHRASEGCAAALQEEAVELSKEVGVARRGVEELRARHAAAAAAADALGKDLCDLKSAGDSRSAALEDAVAGALDKAGVLDRGEYTSSRTGEEELGSEVEASKTETGIVERVATVAATAARIGPLETENTFIHAAAMQLIVLLQRISEDKAAAQVCG